MVPSIRVSRVGRVKVTLTVMVRVGRVRVTVLVGLALWLVSGIALNKYRCEYSTLNSNVCPICLITCSLSA